MPKSPCFFFCACTYVHIYGDTFACEFPSWGPAVLPLCGLNSAGPLRAPAVLSHMKQRSNKK